MSRPIISETTGDAGVLDEAVAVSAGSGAAAKASMTLSSCPRSAQTASLYEHCARALDASLAVGNARPAADGHRRLE